ncbi:MAG: right-handed parallel beta-helix repeat-containing protein [Phycisphaerales bacterium]|nr:right-handed parallel beta-helix repeat-containing protein [Phycisphaerales bacterium]
MNRSTLLATIAICITTIITASILTYAGPLDPPAGPIDSTYRTLTEVEPRTPINSTTTPGDADSVFKIIKPGSYYLTGQLTGANGKIGLEIAASSVSIDLRGFSVVGVNGSLQGIRTTANGNDVTISNGIVRNWGGDGMNLITDDNFGAILTNMHFSGNGNAGCRVDLGAVLSSCTASNNGAEGFVSTGNAIFENCSATSNGEDGFVTYYGTVFRDCSARENTGNGYTINENCSVENCTAYTNGATGFDATFGLTITNSSSVANTAGGFDIGDGSIITHCTARDNGADGITITNATVAFGNNCSGNTAAGIRVFGNDSRIEGNNARENLRGIDVDSVGNIIIRNTASGNTTANYSIVSGNVCYVVNAATAGSIGGSSGGTPPGSTDPSVNFSY